MGIFPKSHTVRASRRKGGQQLVGFLDSFGALASSIVTSIVMLVFAVLSFFITVFIVQVGAGLAEKSPEW